MAKPIKETPSFMTRIPTALKWRLRTSFPCLKRNGKRSSATMKKFVAGVLPMYYEP